MRVQYQQNPEIIFAGEFTDHQGAGACRSFPVHVADAVARDVLANGVQILPAALAVTFQAAFNTEKTFQKIMVGINARIYQRLGVQSDAPGFLQKPEREAGHDAEAILHMQTAPKKGDWNTLLHALLTGEIGKK